MPKLISTEPDEVTAVLIGLIQKNQTEELIEEYLDELAFLAETAGVKSLKKFTQKLEFPNPKTFIGSGKIEEVAQYVETHNVNLIIFDDELSGAQIRNIEKIVKGKVVDRTNLILEIFDQRAQTAHAKVQVELAQYEYMLPRLTGMWTHLERQRGATGTRGGSGEKEIETDRRIVKAKISLLKKKLIEIDKQKSTQRKNRESMIRVALVGYTNVGKSTIMNLISKSEVFAENKLFATLDTTVRKIVIDNLPFLLSDTVGFIRKLPHQLVESFKSTLDEVREADLLVHVVDIAHPQFEDHLKTVNETLASIVDKNKPTILLFNKIDLYRQLHKGEEVEEQLSWFKKTWMSRFYTESQHFDTVAAVFISAEKKENTQEFKSILYDEVKKLHVKRYPYNNFLY